MARGAASFYDLAPHTNPFALSLSKGWSIVDKASTGSTQTVGKATVFSRKKPQPNQRNGLQLSKTSLKAKAGNQFFRLVFQKNGQVDGV